MGLEDLAEFFLEFIGLKYCQENYGSSIANYGKHFFAYN